MKLKLKDNASRLRLSQTDIENLAAKGFVEEQISFSKDVALCYRIEAKEEILKPGNRYAENTITVFIPRDFTNVWPCNSVVDTSAVHTTEDGNEIFILIEKGYQCLDNKDEDQSDNFFNPKLMRL
ncbi:hypothetical protein BH10BAC3_BH10BAC3_10450 [soil metagenome]